MGNTINLKAPDGFTLSAYTAGPAAGTKGLMVIQEIFGVNHHMRDMCDRFATEGYSVCAPALFNRAEKGVELGTSACTNPSAAHKGGARSATVWPHRPAVSWR